MVGMNIDFVAALAALVMGCILWLLAAVLDRWLSRWVANALLAIGALLLAFGIGWGCSFAAFGPGV